ncbi:ABC transporter A family member 4 [Smittium culicis]|uniref:ABC transporter A family member 4 n=1 Tax=Smittium culicis TaxID=133412 RepID=A0A1R1XTM1_9FUNG|nr:ABC transporter A family member 4 [Smittium culicis]
MSLLNKALENNTEESAYISQIAEKFFLLEIKNKVVKNLSGGQKRLLSIAIAFIGEPKVVFLDEPTTGLDPQIRRLIWNIINKNKKNKTIVLSTHSMEEVEVLCDKVGIMVKGRLLCVDSPSKIKHIYGKQYHVTINCNPNNLHRTSQFIEDIIPNSSIVIDSSSNGKTWRVSSSPGIIPNVYKQISSRKTDLYIDDWGINQSTLEDTFISIVSQK